MQSVISRNLASFKIGFMILLIMTIISFSTYGLLLNEFTIIDKSHLHLSFIAYLTISLAASLVGSTLTIRPHQSADDDIDHTAMFAVFSLTFFLSAIEIIAALSPIERAIIFATSVLANSALAYGLMRIALKLLRIKNQYENLLTIAPAIAIFLGGTFLLLTKSYQSPLGPLVINLLKAIPIALIPLLTILTVLVTTYLRLDKFNFIDFISLAFFHKDQKDEKRLFKNLVGINLFCSLAYGALLASYFSGDLKSFPVTNICASWLACFYYTFAYQERRFLLNKINKIVISITSEKAKRFFLRQNKKSTHNWAATVGLKTANFIVDHDPDDIAADNLTATVANIRREEITRYTRKLLGERSLQVKSLGNQLSGVIDPEDSNHPCVDILNLFACIYLDVVPLVERRLKGLSSLFPIIDPGLAHKVNPPSVEEALSSMEWLYRIDYTWVDQQLVLSGSSTSYGVIVNQINSISKNEILQQLRKRNRIGNFIWVSESAKERIKIEAPYLASIIEAWPVKIDKGESFLVYLLKFEELIPRMQKYYCLETARAILRDFDISQDSRRIINLINYQFSQNKTYDEIVDTIQSISSYHWRGFQEKDMALEIVLRAFRRLEKLASSNEDIAPYEKRMAVLIDAIEKIGYPSQILHQAHKKKQSIRSLNLIMEIALDHNHPRFIECWLFACSADPYVYSEEEVVAFVKFLIRSIKNPKLSKIPIVQSKALEAFINFSRRLNQSAYHPLIRSTFSELCLYMIKTKRSAGEFCAMLDGKVFLEDHLKIQIELSEDTKERLDSHFAKMAEHAKEEGSLDQMAALHGRWQILLQDDEHRSESA